MSMLPLRPRPKQDESFASWVNRIASAHDLPFENFVKMIRKRYSDALKEKHLYAGKGFLFYVHPTSVEHEAFVVMMASATGLTGEFLKTLTYKSEACIYFLRFLSPAGRINAQGRKPSHASKSDLYPDSYCPECLAHEYYLRRSWRAAFPCVCFVHTRVLMDRCPGCQAPLNFYGERIPPRSIKHDGSTLLCQTCKLDLTSIPQQLPAPQHLNLISLLHQLYEQKIPIRVPDKFLNILNIFHWWMEGFLKVCTSLPVSPVFPHSGSYSVLRATYAYQSCQVRYALFQAACKAIGRVGQGDPPLEPEEPNIAKWLGPKRWHDFCTIARLLVDTFPELAQQDNVLAPDRSILPAP